jgi:hypothetical protein
MTTTTNFEELRDAEVLRVGTWNGTPITEADLADMVAAFSRAGFTPPIKIGHGEESDAPAYGWVKNLRKAGDKLLADLVDMPQELHDRIKARRYDTISSEIYQNLKRNGETFRRALKAVAILGAQIPAVSGLKPLREHFEQVHTFSQIIHCEVTTMQSIRGTPYIIWQPDAAFIALSENAPLQARRPRTQCYASASKASMSVDAKARELEAKGMPYRDAVRQVLRDDPQLAKEYDGL